MNKKKMENKGFTLVELIVVLVILAILAAILVPALLGYIDRAKEKQYVLNAKSALTATQAEFSSLYGEGKDVLSGTGDTFERGSVVKNTADTPSGTKFYVCVNNNAKEGSNTITGAVPKNHKRFTVTYAAYNEGSYWIVYNGTSWTSTTSDPTGSVPSGTGYDFQKWALIYDGNTN
jgi:prepilin-type N-terminal cleavage/methylation domain-containing protein